MKRYFNTSGPNRPHEHYTLMRAELVAEGQVLVERERYFTIWAPRQTGKSTYFRLLAQALRKQGCQTMHINVESFTKTSVEDLMIYVRAEAQRQWQVEIPLFTGFEAFFNFFNTYEDGRLVLIIDEIEGLNPDLFNQFLHTIRNLYHSREQHSLKSVILVGVSNILGIVQDNASPFNIADNLDIPYFTDEETAELLGQHEAETGQKFAPAVVQKISQITANQPGLVNGFAYQLVKRYPDMPAIGMSEYLAVEDWYLTESIDKNVSNILNKAKQHRHFVEGLLFTQEKVPFKIHEEPIKFLHAQGLIRKDPEGNVQFWVPMYKKALLNSFYPHGNGEQKRIVRTLDYWNYFHADGSLNVAKVIDAYQDYVKRRSFRYFREKGPDGKFLSIKEAALLYSFETYIQAFLLACGGKSYREAHTGVGRSDLILNIEGREYVIEAKIYRYPKQFEDGKRQLTRYLRSVDTDEGWYVVFVPTAVDPVKMRISEGSESIEGTMLHVHLVWYDEDQGFGEHVKE